MHVNVTRCLWRQMDRAGCKQQWALNSLSHPQSSFWPLDKQDVELSAQLQSNTQGIVRDHSKRNREHDKPSFAVLIPGSPGYRRVDGFGCLNLKIHECHRRMTSHLAKAKTFQPWKQRTQGWTQQHRTTCSLSRADRDQLFSLFSDTEEQSEHKAGQNQTPNKMRRASAQQSSRTTEIAINNAGNRSSRRMLRSNLREHLEAHCSSPSLQPQQGERAELKRARRCESSAGRWDLSLLSAPLLVFPMHSLVEAGRKQNWANRTLGPALFNSRLEHISIFSRFLRTPGDIVKSSHKNVTSQLKESDPNGRGKGEDYQLYENLGVLPSEKYYVKYL